MSDLFLFKNKTLLGIEATGKSISIGLYKKDTPMGEFFFNHRIQLSCILLQSIEDLLKKCDVSKHELDAVCVSLGPGSFTSLRISVATAQALSLGLKIPIFGTNSLQLIASSVPYYSHIVKVIQEAYKREFYVASYSTKYGTPKEITPIQLQTPSKFFDSLQKEELILGSGIKKLISLNLEPEKKEARVIFGQKNYPKSIPLLEYFIEKKSEKISTKPLIPIYIRASEAEINYPY